ncbi:uncharacterized protein LOC121867163 [Homarus americanus]|uniref:uncharacterized protein LOC121867163 n=1 Tax=Homarus americanus TaxID=6706 RepID=UPI001C47646A|nr:uncharacterized protein LOC121867163 [Homarus americanus]
MPGPICKPSSPSDNTSCDLSVFESCEDMPQGWEGLNGNLSNESIYHDCDKHYQNDYHKKYVNGSELEYSEIYRTMSTTEIIKTEAASSEYDDMDSELEGQDKEKGLSSVKECSEDMEVEDEESEEAVETINVPVVEACLSVDISTSLTRQKIASVQRGRTLSYADKDDAEESPTRRTRALAYANESIDRGMPLHHRPSVQNEGRENHKLTPSTSRSNRVSRNPSYQLAVRDATALSPKRVNKPEKLDKDCSSAEENTTSDKNSVENTTKDKKGTEYNKRHLSAGDEITMPLAANMPRSVSFSGPEKVSPSLPASGSLSEGNSRSGSVSQLSALTSKRSSPLSPEKASPTIVRGSAITRSFRRLFSTPARTIPTSPPEEFWPDVPDVQGSSTSEPRTPSRLRKLSSSLSRRLSTRSKMSDKSNSPGTNGHQLLTLNGTAVFEDSDNLVEYEDLLKLFCCSGCQEFMAPPLHQCRKGHLVCGSCRFSLKQVCPVCKQRFADNTNQMMEQVCQLVKFPCRWANQGCPEYHRPRAKLDHEHFCVYRPVHCHHGPKGCPKVLILRDMSQHLNQCDFKDK